MNQRLAILLCVVTLAASGPALAADAPATQPSEIQQRLSPSNVKLPVLPPLVQSPRDWRKPTLTSMPALKTPMPLISAVHTPRLVGPETRPTSRPILTPNLPSLALLPQSAPPSSVQMPVAPLTHIEPPDIFAMTTLSIWNRPAGTGTQVNVNPTFRHSQAIALRAVPPFRSTPANFLRLSIPDPNEGIAAVKLTTSPPDSEPPVRVMTAPPVPPMPVK